MSRSDKLCTLQPAGSLLHYGLRITPQPPPPREGEGRRAILTEEPTAVTLSVCLTGSRSPRSWGGYGQTGSTSLSGKLFSLPFLKSLAFG